LAYTGGGVEGRRGVLASKSRGERGKEKEEGDLKLRSVRLVSGRG